MNGCKSPASAPEKTGHSTKGSNAPECSEDLKAEVKFSDTKPISMASSEEKVSSWVKEGEYSGFVFEARAGQNFSVNTAQDICIGLFIPDRSLLQSIKASEATIKLPEDGQYLIQISPLKKTTVFTLAMKLEPLPPVVTPKSTPTAKTVEPPSTSKNFAEDSPDLDKILAHIKKSEVVFTSSTKETFVGNIYKNHIQNKENPNDSGAVAKIRWNDGENSSMLFLKTSRVRVWQRGKEYDGRWYWSSDKKKLFVKMDAGSLYEFKS